jgi:LAO/AO transport system kinase
VRDWDRVLVAAADGSDAAVARFLSALEARDWTALAALGRRVTAAGGQPVATRIGLTGAAGAGKSSLVAALSHAWPGDGRVGAVAIDPSSDLTGGAVLGDRCRLYAQVRPSEAGAGGSRLYLRSMAARGSASALSRYAGAAVTLLESVGFDPVLVETAGAGQSDVGIRQEIDCLVLVLTPESGDVIQMLKAGLMEHADLYAVNKADRDGARQFASQLRAVIARQGTVNGRTAAQRVHLVQATDPDDPGLRGLAAALFDWPPATGADRQQAWLRVVGRLAESSLIEHLRRRLDGQDWARAVDQCAAGEVQLDHAVDRALGGLVGQTVGAAG